MDWVIVRCKPTLTVEDFEADWAGDCWIPQQRVKRGGEITMENVMRGILFVPRDHWPAFRRKAPERYGCAAYQHLSTGQPRTMPQRDVTAMMEALSRPPMPNPMKIGDTVMCALGPWAGLGGVLLKLATPRTVRVQFVDEFATIPKVFIKRI